MGVEVIILVSRQGKVRLTKFYEHYSKSQQARIVHDISTMVLERPSKACNFLEYQGKRIIYKRYASLYFATLVNVEDNELAVLEIIHHYVEVLDRYFGNVCELDIIFNFHKAYFLLDEVLIGGELQETSKREILRVCAAQDDLMDEDREKERRLGRRSR